MDLLTPSKRIPLVNLDVIGSRPEPVVPDGVWIEVQGHVLNNEAVYNAQHEEERIKLTHQYKDDQLKKFQKDVKKRVTRAAILQRKLVTDSQSIKMEKEREVLYRSASAAERSTPKKNRCTYNVNPITIDCTGKLTADVARTNSKELLEVDPVLHICNKRLQDLTLGARQRLAQRCIIPTKEELERTNIGDDHPLPGGLWGVGTTREKCGARLYTQADINTADHTVKSHNVEEDATSTSHPQEEDSKAPSQKRGIDFSSNDEDVSSELSKDATSNDANASEDDSPAQAEPSYSCVTNNVHFKLPETLILDGQDDNPSRKDFHKSTLVSRSIPANHNPNDNYNFDVVQKPRNTKFKNENDVPVPPILRPGAVAYSQKLADEKSRWLSRRVFADAERERSREHSRLKEHKRRVERLRAESEKERAEMEQKSREQVEAVSLANERLRIQAEKRERKVRIKKKKEMKKQQQTERFVSAIRVQLKDRLKHNKVELPPLCLCGSTFWDTNPDTCANNCIFYRNQKAFAKALEAVLQAVDRDIGPFHKDSLQRSAVSLPLVPEDDDEDPGDATIPSSARTYSSRSDHSSSLSLGSL